MTIKKIKKLIPAIALIAILVALSSCNRGMGCPKFSLENNLVEVVELIPDLFIHE